MIHQRTSMASIATSSLKAVAPALRLATPRLCSTSAGKGFGKTSSKRVETESAGYLKAEPSARIAKELGVSKPAAPVPGEAPAAVDPKKGWRSMGVQAELFSAKEVKAVDLGNKAFALYQYKGQVYCSDALSTAYKYPLIDGKVFDGAAGQPVVEVPLDGTQYALETGKVVVWCPRTGPVRTVLGALKKDAIEEDLKVYPVQVIEGKVYAKLS